MTTPKTVIIDDKFSDYADWNESAQTFTYNGETYTVGQNAFVYAYQTPMENNAPYLAWNAVEDGDTIVIGCWNTKFGEDAYWSKEGTIYFDTVDGSLQSQYYFYVNSAIVLKAGANLGTGFYDMEEGGSLTIEGGACLTLSGGCGGTMYNPMQNVTVYGTLKAIEGTGFNFSGQNKVIGSQEEAGTFDATAKMYVNSTFVLKEDASLNLTQGAVADISSTASILEANSILELDNSKYISNTLSIADGAAINLDADSKLVVTGATTNNGAITVDATGFTGLFAKVVDLNGLTGDKATVENLEEGINAICTPTGDVILTSADVEHFLIDSSWTGLNEADPIEGKEGYYYNVNAYSDLATAYDNMPVGITQDIDILNGTIDFAGSPRPDYPAVKEIGNVDVIVEAGAALRIAGHEMDWGYADDSSDDGVLTIKAGGKLIAQDGNSHLYAQGSTQIVLDGEEGNLAVIDFAYNDDQRANLSITTNSQLISNYGDIKVERLYLSAKGCISLTNTTANVDNGLQLGNNSWAGMLTKLELDNSSLTVRDYQASWIYGTINVANNSTYTTNAKESGNKLATTLENNGSINVSSNSQMVVDCNFDNAKILTLSDASTLTITGDAASAYRTTITGASTMTVGADFTNTKKVTLDAESKLIVAGETTNNGTITVDATGYTGLYSKVIDLNGYTGSKAVVENLEDGIHAIQSASGDVILTSANVETFLINDSWKNLADGAAIEGKDGYYYNVNAYSDLGTAYYNMPDGATKLLDILGGTIDYAANVGNVDLTVEDDATLQTIGGDYVNWGDKDANETENEDASVLTIKAGATLSAKDGNSHLWAQGKTQIVLAGTDNDNRAIIDFAYADDQRANLYITNNSQLVSNYGIITVDQLVARANGAISLTNTTADVDNNLIIGPEGHTNAKMTLDSSSLTVRDNEASAIYGTIDVANKSTYTTNAKDANDTAATTLTSDGTINVSGASTMAVNCNFTNNGAVTLDATSKLTVANALTNNGTLDAKLGAAITTGTFEAGANSKLTFDMGESLTAGYYKLVDTDGSKTMTLADFGTVAIGDVEYATAVLNDCKDIADEDKNDLYAIQLSNIVIDTRADAMSNLAMGYVADINAFTSFEAANADETACGTRTYEITYGVDSLVYLGVSMEKGTSSISFGEKGKEASMTYLVAGSKQLELKMDANTTYVLSFTGDNADFAFTVDPEKSVEAKVQEDETIAAIGETPAEGEKGWTENTPTDSDEKTTYTYADDDTTVVENTAYVGYKTEAKEYTFTVGANDSGEYTFTLNANLTDINDEYKTARIKYSIVNSTTKKTLVSGSTTSSITRKLDLTSGTYVVTVDSYDSGSGKYNSNYTFSIEATRNQDVSTLDDEITNEKIDAGNVYKSLGTADGATGFIGLGDKTDYIALDALSDSGNYTFTLKVDEGTDAKGLRFNLVSWDDTKEKATSIKSMSYTGSDLSTGELTLDKNKKYFIQLSTATASTSSKNATYALSMVQNSTMDADKMSSDDDTVSGAVDWSANDYYENWVGTQDTVDYVKLTDLENGKKYTLGVTVESGTSRVAVTLYRAKKGTTSLSTVASLNGYANKGEATKTFSCTSDTYDYYVRFKSVAGSKVSTDYLATLTKQA